MDTKEKILQSTFLLLLEKGYDRISISDIQKKSGVSRGLLYYFFENKSDLLFAACREYFFDKFMTKVNPQTTTLYEFIQHIHTVVDDMTEIGTTKVDILRYNTIYSSILLCEPRFWDYVLKEFSKAVVIIENAKKRGEIKNLPTNFIGATLLSILGRTSYITATPSNEYIRNRILEDIEEFYNLIKS